MSDAAIMITLMLSIIAAMLITRLRLY